ncbi:hypothetical protein DD236_03975 [Ancrocorticia populi]|uniref:Uncharacterized protein n=1 Tax=Ancrocorticia populi TaxID=2175228 RepID=A0A2V1K8S7_9ACTO|nr:hypothetical protein DD236_03975 [Ancrocorticia populi]
MVPILVVKQVIRLYCDTKGGVVMLLILLRKLGFGSVTPMGGIRVPQDIFNVRSFSELFSV